MSAPLLIKADRLLVEGRLESALDVLVTEGRVNAIGRDLIAPGAKVLAAAVVSPGFVDLHVHALDGCGLVGEGPPDVPGLARALASRGVTGFLATTVAAPVAELVALLGALTETGGAAKCLGAHLEGPWLASAKAGAQPTAALVPPRLEDLALLLAAGPVAVLTLAPELAGALEVIAAASAAGVVVSLGHSAATFAQAQAALEAGATHITHCFNAMSALHHREPGLVGLALDDPAVTVEAIADGEHLHPAVVRLLWRAAGIQRVCLVSDAVDIALPGTSAAQLDDGRLAGSRVGLDACVRNCVKWGIPLADALTMASVTPAAVLGRRHGLVAGGVADLVLLDADLGVLTTVVDGVVAWQR